MNRRLGLPLALAVVLSMATSATAAPDGVTVGGTASHAGALVTCGATATYFQAATGVAPSYTTTTGVVTSWSITPRAVADPGRMALKIARAGATDTFTITGSSEVQQLVPDRLNTFRTRIRVQAGDVLGLYLPPQPAPGCLMPGTTGDSIAFGGTDPDPAVGTPVNAPLVAADHRINVSAQIEPDADGDGFGDLTQDHCPALKNSHDDCTAPDTFLKSAPRKLTTPGGKAKAKVAFFASEPDATYTCAVDSGAARPCASPFQTRLKVGKHTVVVVATDPVGNTDATPLLVRIKVKKRA